MTFEQSFLRYNISLIFIITIKLSNI